MKLKDSNRILWGKYIGYMMKDVPASYLLWIKDNVAPNMGNQNVFDYINDNIEVLKKETK